MLKNYLEKEKCVRASATGTNTLTLLSSVREHWVPNQQQKSSVITLHQNNYSSLYHLTWCKVNTLGTPKKKNVRDFPLAHFL